MKIAAVQLRPATGDIAANVAKHLDHIDRAVAHGAELVFFPELSLTGYEPRLAQSLATHAADPRLDVFQQRSDARHIIIGLGVPLAARSGTQIGMVWFAPSSPRRIYAKQLLHADELAFFVAGTQPLLLEAGGRKVAPAICYESLQPSHAENAAGLGADTYLASVAKPAGPMARAMLHYPAIARQHALYVIMADSVGPSDDFVSVGQSAAWDPAGNLLAQLDSDCEGILLVDITRGAATTHRDHA